MKNLKISARALALILVMALLFTSCAASPQSAISSDSGGFPPASADGTRQTAAQTAVIAANPSPFASVLPQAAASELIFEDKWYGNGVINIQFPQISNLSDTVLQGQLNQLISESAFRDYSFMENNTDLTEYQLTGTVTYNSPSLFSIYFVGYDIFKQSAHPNQFLYAVTIDVQNARTLPLKELVQINERFVGTMLAGTYHSMMGYTMTSDLRASITNYLDETNTDSWITQLDNAGTSGHDTASYLTEDALAISVTVPHYMGDHVEILLPYQDLKDFRMGSPLWNVLLG